MMHKWNNLDKNLWAGKSWLMILSETALSLIQESPEL